MESNVIVGLDIGTCYTRVAVGEVIENYETGERTVEILGVAKRPTKGVRNGIIVNIEEVANVVHDVCADAEVKAGDYVTRVITGIGGSVVESINSSGGVALTGQNHEVSQKDIDKVIEAATAVQIPSASKKLHVIPQEYEVVPAGIGTPIHTKSPLHMVGVRLDVKVHIITASETVLSSLSKCLMRSKIEMDRVMLKTLAVTETIMRDDEKELGSILIDLGGGTTDVIVIVDDAPVCTASIPVGGNLVTNDIAIVGGILKQQAEDVKVKYGCCWQPLASEEDMEIVVPGAGGGSPIQFKRSELCTIIQPRMEEIFTMVRDEICRCSGISELSGNIILTGGGALLPGVEDLAKDVFGTTAVRVGKPDNYGRRETDYRSPEWATAVGFVVANKNVNLHRDSKTKRSQAKKSEKSESSKKSLWDKFKGAFF